MATTRRVTWPGPRPKRTTRPRGQAPAPDPRAARYLRLVTALCADWGWPAPLAEHRFNADRKWRFDLAWPGQWVAVEVQGGLFTAGRHTRGPSLQREYDKLNDAQIRGWIVLLVTPAQIKSGHLTDLLAAYFGRWYPVTVGGPPDTPDHD